MPRRKQSRGECAYCAQEVARGGMLKHLASCSQHRATIEQADAKRGASETLYQLWVQGRGYADFWLVMEMRSRATLEDLDYYLRAIWLECCGHLSQFSEGGWRGEEISMSRCVREVFTPGLELTHIYDFGTSSETLIKVMGERQGRPTTSQPLALMARNLPPESRCVECGQPAGWLCIECLYEENVWGTLCAEHMRTHPHENYGDPVPLFNSPRMGMCGYRGPAKPPY